MCTTYLPLELCRFCGDGLGDQQVERPSGGAVNTHRLQPGQQHAKVGIALHELQPCEDDNKNTSS